VKHTRLLVWEMSTLRGGLGAGRRQKRLSHFIGGRGVGKTGRSGGIVGGTGWVAGSEVGGRKCSPHHGRKQRPGGQLFEVRGDLGSEKRGEAVQ